MRRAETKKLVRLACFLIAHNASGYGHWPHAGVIYYLIFIHIAKASKTFGRFLRPLAIGVCYELYSGEPSLTN